MLLLLAIIFDDRSAFHHELDALQFGDVRSRIAFDRNDVGKAARLKASDAVLPAEQFSGVDGRGANDFKWRHASFGVSPKHQQTRLPARFAGCLIVFIRTGSNTHTGFESAREPLAAAARKHLNSSFLLFLLLWRQ